MQKNSGAVELSTVQHMNIRPCCDSYLHFSISVKYNGFSIAEVFVWF